MKRNKLILSFQFILFSIIFLFIFSSTSYSQSSPEYWMIFNTKNSAIPVNEIRSLAIDIDGSKWISSFEGHITHFDGTNWTNYNSSNSPYSDHPVPHISIDMDGTKWIMTRGSGIYTFDNTLWFNYNVLTTSKLLPGGPDNYLVKIKACDNGGVLLPSSPQLCNIDTATINANEIISPTPTPTPNPTPAPSNLNNFVILAEQGAWLKQGVNIMDGNIAINNMSSGSFLDSAF